jgi:hypothetical protein
VQVDIQIEQELADLLNAAAGGAAAAAAAAAGDEAAAAGAAGDDGGMPMHITCLDPLVELQQLKTLEVLSPMMPITEQGLECLFIKETPQQQQQQQPAGAARAVSSSSSKAGVVYKPALPQLSTLALSGGASMRWHGMHWALHQDGHR